MLRDDEYDGCHQAAHKAYSCCSRRAKKIRAPAIRCGASKVNRASGYYRWWCLLVYVQHEIKGLCRQRHRWMVMQSTTRIIVELCIYKTVWPIEALWLMHSRMHLQVNHILRYSEMCATKPVSMAEHALMLHAYWNAHQFGLHKAYMQWMKQQ